MLCVVYSKGIKFKKERLMKMKKRTLNNLISLVLSNILLLLIVFIPANAAVKEEVSPCYNNVVSTDTFVSISNSGVIKTTNSYTGDRTVTTKAVITTYIEKKVLGLFWIRVDIGQVNDEWVDTIYNYEYTGSHSTQLPSTGTYRVTVKYIIYGSGGVADTIVKEVEKSY